MFASNRLGWPMSTTNRVFIGQAYQPHLPMPCTAIDKRGLEGLETPNIFICTPVVIGAFLYDDFLVRFRFDT